jgi:hypothetical protein
MLRNVYLQVLFIVVFCAIVGVDLIELGELWVKAYRCSRCSWLNWSPKCRECESTIPANHSISTKASLLTSERNESVQSYSNGTSNSTEAALASFVTWNESVQLYSNDTSNSTEAVVEPFKTWLLVVVVVVVVVAVVILISILVALAVLYRRGYFRPVAHVPVPESPSLTEIQNGSNMDAEAAPFLDDVETGTSPAGFELSTLKEIQNGSDGDVYYISFVDEILNDIQKL